MSDSLTTGASIGGGGSPLQTPLLGQVIDPWGAMTAYNKGMASQYAVPEIQSQIALRSAQAEQAHAQSGLIGAQTYGQGLKNQLIGMGIDTLNQPPPDESGLPWGQNGGSSYGGSGGGGDGSGVALGMRQNNPGNLRFAGQPNATNGTKGFATFPDMPTGVAATADQLAMYQTQHGIDTVRGAVTRWVSDPKADLTGSGPGGSEVKPGSYIGDVAKALGVGPDDKIDLTNPAVQEKFILAQQPHESAGGGAVLNPADVHKGVLMAASQHGQKVQVAGNQPAANQPAPAANQVAANGPFLGATNTEPVQAPPQSGYLRAQAPGGPNGGGNIPPVYTGSNGTMMFGTPMPKLMAVGILQSEDRPAAYKQAVETRKALLGQYIQGAMRQDGSIDPDGWNYAVKQAYNAGLITNVDAWRYYGHPEQAQGAINSLLNPQETPAVRGAVAGAEAGGRLPAEIARENARPYNVEPGQTHVVPAPSGAAAAPAPAAPAPGPAAPAAPAAAPAAQPAAAPAGGAGAAPGGAGATPAPAAPPPWQEEAAPPPSGVTVTQMPGGGQAVTPNLSKGDIETQQANAKDTATYKTDQAEKSQAAVKANAVVDQMRLHSQTWTGGFGTGEKMALLNVWDSVRRNINSAFGKDVLGQPSQSVGDYQDTVKNFGELTRAAVQATSPRASYQEFNNIMKTLPGGDMSDQGKRMIFDQMQGLNDWAIAKNQAAAHLSGRENPAAFEARWASIDPEAFIVRRMSPQDFKEFAGRMSQTEAGRAELKNIASQMVKLGSWGLLPNPTQIPTGRQP